MNEYRYGEGLDEATRARLAGLFARRDDVWSRFAHFYRQVAALPRPWRRQLRRKLALTTAGAALLLALAGPAVPVLRAQDAPNAVITVVNGEVAVVDNNKCSLIEAIINARTTRPGQMHNDCTTGNLSGPDTVSLPTNGLFVLTQAHNEQFGSTGLPVITSAVTIDGHGSEIRRADGADDFRIMAVDSDGNLTLNDTTIARGLANLYAEYGGGLLIQLGGQATISGSTFVGNRAGWYGGGGGGIAIRGQADIVNSTFGDNFAGGFFDGSSGGGILVDSEGQATITGSTIINNDVSSPYGSSGGGIAIWGTAEIIDSTIAGNINHGDEYGGDGGGVYVAEGAQATITGSTLSGNVAHPYYEYYGGYWEGRGGALSNHGTTLIVNTTISGNIASDGGGLNNSGYGQLTVIHSTLSNNEAQYDLYDEMGTGGTGGGLRAGGCADTTLRGVILSGNVADVEAPEAAFVPSDSCGATMTVNAHNVFGHSGSSGLNGFTPGPTDIVPSVGLAAILGPLADNGGPTMTHALPPGSPALDLAPNASCTAAPVNGVDQRGEPRNQNGAGGASGNECDSGSFELQAGGGGGAFLVSAAGSGTAGGVAFTPADILRYDGSQWTMYFDGSDVGLTKNLTAFEVEDNGDILLSLAAKQNVTGVGLVQPQDVLRFIPSSTGNNTAGSFVMEVDGSANLLTTTGERIDALGRTNGRLAISTVDVAVVKRPDNTTLKAQDEDALGFNPINGQWSEYFNGTPIPGLKAEDVNGLWIDTATGDLYISIAGTFNVAGVAGNGKDIVKLSPNGGAPGGYSASLWYDGAAAGFPAAIDGIELLP